MLTPRFCSSNTRPNSFPIGSLISAPTALKPKARLCPERRTRAIISRASGSCVLKVFKPLLAAKQEPAHGQRTGGDAAQRDRRRRALHGDRRGAPGQPQDGRKGGQAANGERRIGLLEKQIEVAELLEPLGQHAGRVVQGPCQDAVVLEHVVLARRRSDAGQDVQAVLQSRRLRLGEEHYGPAHEGRHADESQDADEQRIHA